MTEVTQHNLLFWEFVHRLIFKGAQRFRIRLCSKEGKEAPNLRDPFAELLSVTGHHRDSKLLRYAPANRSIPRVVTGKWLLKN